MTISHGYHGTQGPGAKNSDVVWPRVGQVRSMPGRSNIERSVVAFLFTREALLRAQQREPPASLPIFPGTFKLVRPRQFFLRKYKDRQMRSMNYAVRRPGSWGVCGRRKGASAKSIAIVAGLSTKTWRVHLIRIGKMNQLSLRQGRWKSVVTIRYHMIV